ncbi:MAG: zinc ABC transporter substrate-binding protein [bacterium]|nr:zinc ABC transporter substrate-binding protein [bacterium]
MLFGPEKAAAAPRVVASIKPVHALVAGVMEGAGAPRLLIGGSASAHTYSLRPSQARALQQAGIVFWVGEELETFLVRILKSLPRGARVVSLLKAPGLKRHPTREGGMWEQDADHDDGGKKHPAREEIDPHIWLNPENARAMVRRIIEVLQKTDPRNAGRYAENGARLSRRIRALEAEIGARLRPLRAAPFVVFHDAYQYFERHFQLRGVGSIAVSPDRRPGARRILQIRRRLRAAPSMCLFSEPQFSPGIVDTLIAGTPTRTGVLDPLGVDVPPGKEAYFAIMRNLADAFVRCLSGGKGAGR